MLSSEYGWKTDYIFSLTVYEIKWRLNKIGKRINSKREFEMAIHGIKTDSKEEVKPVKMDDKDKKIHDHALNQAMKRKKMELSKK